MPDYKKEHPKEKTKLHPRNKHRERYNFDQLITGCPELAAFVELNAYGDASINFFNPIAVKALNKALLFHFYGINYWDIPPDYLCPPIPGRSDYIHYMADLINDSYRKLAPQKRNTSNQIMCLDVGVGANCVYPIIGAATYGWSFIGSDIDPVALASAKQIVELNPSLKGKIELRLTVPKAIFKEIIRKGECIDLSICNPPFHASFADAQAGAVRKLNNLKRNKIDKLVLNFGGQHNELWCTGGEAKFVNDMILESKQFATSCFWFSSLISKQSTLKNVYAALEKVKAVEIKTITMGQGNKISRIVAWTFLTKPQQLIWIQNRWTGTN